ncbi:hypothetical protein EV368DRAFT_90308, partial [Lentinula lateritia]
MAHKKVAVLQRLLDTCWKIGCITRRTWKKGNTPLTFGKKNNSYGQGTPTAAEIQFRFPGHTLEQVVTDIFQSQQLKESSKDISCDAAFTSAQMQILNANTPEGQPHQKVHQCSKIIAEKWRAMSDEERVVATKREVVALHEWRESKELGTWHNAVM